MSEMEKINKLCGSVAQMVGRDGVVPEATLAELGIDSLNVLELLSLCEQIYDRSGDLESLQFDEFTSLQSLHQQFFNM